MVGLAEGWLSEINTLTQKSEAPAPFVVTFLLQGISRCFNIVLKTAKHNLGLVMLLYIVRVMFVIILKTLEIRESNFKALKVKVLEINHYWFLVLASPSFLMC